jgi:hypothetical protein
VRGVGQSGHDRDLRGVKSSPHGREQYAG